MVVILAVWGVLGAQQEIGFPFTHKQGRCQSFWCHMQDVLRVLQRPQGSFCREVASGERRHSSPDSFLARGSCWLHSSVSFLHCPGLQTVQKGDSCLRLPQEGKLSNVEHCLVSVPAACHLAPSTACGRWRDRAGMTEMCSRAPLQGLYPRQLPWPPIWMHQPCLQVLCGSPLVLIDSSYIHLWQSIFWYKPTPNYDGDG